MKLYEGLKIEFHAPRVRETSGLMLCEPSAVGKDSQDIADMAQEAFCVVTLNTKNRKICRHLITLGVVDQSLVHPREVFRAAITDGATSVILVHNHPSGDATPSAEDIRITKQLVDAGKIIAINVLDHVIVCKPHGDNPAYISLRESGLVSF